MRNRFGVGIGLLKGWVVVRLRINELGEISGSGVVRA